MLWTLFGGQCRISWCRVFHVVCMQALKRLHGVMQDANVQGPVLRIDAFGICGFGFRVSGLTNLH